MASGSAVSTGNVDILHDIGQLGKEEEFDLRQLQLQIVYIEDFRCFYLEPCNDHTRPYTVTDHPEPEWPHTISPHLSVTAYLEELPGFTSDGAADTEARMYPAMCITRSLPSDQRFANSTRLHVQHCRNYRYGD